MSSSDFVSKKDFDKLSDQLDEKFSHFEALLSRGNIFATPKMPVQITKPQVSDQTFIDPSSARATGPVRSPAVQESGSNGNPKDKKKHKSHHKSSKTKPAPVGEATGPVQETFTDTLHQLTKPVPVGESTGPVQGTDTFPQKEPVPVMSGPTGEPIMGIFNCTGVSDVTTDVEHPLTMRVPYLYQQMNHFLGDILHLTRTVRMVNFLNLILTNPRRMRT